MWRSRNNSSLAKLVLYIHALEYYQNSIIRWTINTLAALHKWNININIFILSVYLLVLFLYIFVFDSCHSLSLYFDTPGWAQYLFYRKHWIVNPSGFGEGSLINSRIEITELYYIAYTWYRRGRMYEPEIRDFSPGGMNSPSRTVGYDSEPFPTIIREFFSQLQPISIFVRQRHIPFFSS